MKRAADTIGCHVDIRSPRSHHEAKTAWVHTEQSREGLALLFGSALDAKTLTRTSLNGALHAQLVHQT